MTFDIRLSGEVLCVVWNEAEINYYLSMTFATDALLPLHYLPLFPQCLLTLHAEPFRRQSPAGFFLPLLLLRLSSSFILLCCFYI